MAKRAKDLKVEDLKAKYRKAVKAGDDLQIDPGTPVAIAEDGTGAWVKVWVWVPSYDV